MRHSSDPLIRSDRKRITIRNQRKERIGWFFVDTKEKHAMPYTHHRGLTAVTGWVRLKLAA